MVENIIPTTVREGVLFFIRSTFGATTLISGPFEIEFSHVRSQTAAKHQEPVEVVPGTVEGREELDRMGYIVRVLKCERIGPR